MRLTRDDRRVIVADLAEQGMSTSAIAPVIGKTEGTVRSDLRGQVRSDYAPGLVPSFDPLRGRSRGEVHLIPEALEGLSSKPIAGARTGRAEVSEVRNHRRSIPFAGAVINRVSDVIVGG